ncbi:prepilin-type N-terminal cleavage/methylation domain-containing protein [Sodalis-like symbiont of Bactericera trigonica]|nr:prepilin-type N-terminal cleavage/methylation domain-containing protein [Sodalis-like symbiont of Bactericera trigonica]
MKGVTVPHKRDGAHAVAETSCPSLPMTASHTFLNDTDRDRGYTLLELLLALTLTVLLVLSGSYGWRQYQSARQLASSAHQLLDVIVCQQWHAAWGNPPLTIDRDNRRTLAVARRSPVRFSSWGGGRGALYRALCRRPSVGIDDG